MNFLLKYRSVLVLMLLFAIAFAGCNRKPAGGATTGEGGSAKKTVAFAQTETDGPWRIAESNSMKDEAAKRADKYEFVTTNAQGKTPKQVSDVEDLIARKVSAIFLAPREAEGFSSSFQSAKAANIPVILIDREANGTAGTDFVTVIKSDFVKEGQRAGEWLAKQTNGKAGIVELKGTTGSSVANDRSKGFMDAISKSPDMKIIASQDADFNRAKGQQVMENIIQAKGKEITAVYAHNDEMALGAIAALKAANMNPGKDVMVVSVDGQKSALQAIIAGDMNATVECNPRFGPIAFDTLEKFWKGEKLPAQIINEDRFFDASNAAQFVNEAY
ncbi:MAG: ABC transporter substrate-binding protein [Acidobacteriota bacterium]|nr:ABC transporter substrate-binding protein [Acidobacteriota bacterium]